MMKYGAMPVVVDTTKVDIFKQITTINVHFFWTNSCC